MVGVAIAVVALVAVLVWPVKVVCPNGPCTTGIDESGYIHRYYEVKPLGASLLNLPFHYSSGRDSEKRNGR